MANEINNISSAAVCIEVGVRDKGSAALVAPILISSWGFRTDTLQRIAVGTYTIELTQPQSAVYTGTGFFIEDADYVFLATYVLINPPGFVTTQITRDDIFAPLPAAGTPVELTHLIAITLDDTPAPSDDIHAIVSAEVRQVPQG